MPATVYLGVRLAGRKHLISRRMLKGISYVTILHIRVDDYFKAIVFETAASKTANAPVFIRNRVAAEVQRKPLTVHVERTCPLAPYFRTDLYKSPDGKETVKLNGCTKKYRQIVFFRNDSLAPALLLSS
ncbi:hypothetical protein EVAR_23030_1 [Eumeta japonica]|uniref:Uncharacterized protein n=1 Tax=Eumeta variegata TaxID=151549 RepID=A0A4C1UQ61_EUMVA|nr:hypothetical protein EVAR_23030_1 [Eumeta japonica]